GSASSGRSSPSLDQMTAGGSPLKKFLRKRGADETPSEAGAGSVGDAETGDSRPPLRKSEEKNEEEKTEEGLRPKTFADRVTLCVGHVSRGFRLVAERIVVLSDNELFHRTELQRTAPRKSRLESRAIDTFLDLSPGDLVVHLSHGIARFRGMEVQTKGELVEEMLSLEFADNLKMQVPVSLIHLVQKYVGGTKGTVELSKYGGVSWANKKKRVTEAVSDMAADMLTLQAERDHKPGLACPPDSHWVEEFDAAFPYTETGDQLKAIAETKEDQQRPRPMDRLICGDVGYGKTEVAMRAAFKAVDAGRQVAILVPTTVLCEQHFRSFSERMAEFPVNIASLNRFRSPSETREVLQGLAEGTIDVVIGTHRLVSKDVKFKDLGLLVIDEEQRFGVEVKELLKHMRLEVDVLTLSATPIPRTLHMSLVGVRDISNLETPPHDRLAVETRICRWDGELIRSSIVRELNRNGQTFFVHNRVYNIQMVADKIRSLVPEATVDIVHGQMGEDDMEAAMLGFVEGRTDVLVATTIIESGLDIPNANTIFIHQADKYGLADLHQLRGRVGRYKHRAYCYLVLEEGRSLTPQASRRLKAIQEYSELGAGFKIAMRDLEIRGAGNILGTEQSGHIAAVGYELYCQLLENAVRAIKREPLREYHHVEISLALEAFLPSTYIPDGRPKIEMYRKLSSVSSLEQLAELKDEFRDRFGPLPAPAERMFEVRELQLLAWRWQIDHIRVFEGDVVFGYLNPRLIARLAKYSHTTLRVVDDREACLILPPKLKGTKALLRLLKETLQLSPG
ncbi:MAG: transcription-repair coupling factor, partial [Candidatus Saccharimonas sp.]|nr:transcription-repair coupling factor [Planctomycetaceae bacterium]